ncbi:MAG: type II secretion system protein GspM [Desulfuromonadales bacterium]|nr:type II secretion system protein GspM [Desulfuromonadales bacterium]
MINHLRQLSQRDRMALIILGTVVGLTLLYLAIIEPYRNSIATLDRKIATRQAQTLRITELATEYTTLRQKLTEVEKTLAQHRGFSLFSFVEKLVDRIAGRENLVYMRPQPPVELNGVKEETVAIKLEKLRFDQFTTLLYRIETADAPLQVKNLRLKSRFDNATLLDGVLTVAAYGKMP